MVGNADSACFVIIYITIRYLMNVKYNGPLQKNHLTRYLSNEFGYQQTTYLETDFTSNLVAAKCISVQ